MCELKIATSVGQAALRYYAFQHSALCRERECRSETCSQEANLRSPHRVSPCVIAPGATGGSPGGFGHPTWSHFKPPSGPVRPGRLAFTMMAAEALHFVSTNVSLAVENVQTVRTAVSQQWAWCWRRGVTPSAAFSSPSEGRWRLLHSTFRAGDSPPDVNCD